MIQNLLSRMRMEAMQAVGRQGLRIGIVVETSYDPSNFAVKVQVQPDGYQTGWIPIPTIWQGNGWGLQCPPSGGDQVLLGFIEGVEDPQILCGLFWDARRPVAGVQQGEFWLTHESGSQLKFTNDSKVTLVSAGDLDITTQGNVNLTVNGNISSSANQWNHTGAMAIDGNVNVTGTLAAADDVTSSNSEISLTNHVHGGVQTGSGESGAPVP